MMPIQHVRKKTVVYNYVWASSDIQSGSVQIFYETRVFMKMLHTLNKHRLRLSKNRIYSVCGTDVPSEIRKKKNTHCPIIVFKIPTDISNIHTYQWRNWDF